MLGWRLLGSMLLAAAAVVAIDRLTERRGLLPPGFRVDRPGGLASARRGIALAGLAVVLWIGVFAPLASIGLASEPDLSEVSTPRLFLLHGLLVAVLAIWYLLGFVAVRRRPSPPPQPATEEGAEPVEPDLAGETVAAASPGPRRALGWPAQLGFRATAVWRELGLGLAAGAVAWMAVLVILVTVGLVIYAFGGEDALPDSPPAIVPWIAALPVGIRLAISLSAGVVEETFFRGFLQPRVGIAFSTLLFVLAHAGYEQPIMLVGITLLSLAYAYLVRWRQNIWPAVAAHSLFDAVQLLVVIPAVLELLPEGGGEGIRTLAHLAALLSPA